MPGSIDPRFNAINNKVNTVVGLKQYQRVKKTMEEFDSKLRQEMDKPPKVDRQIK